MNLREQLRLSHPATLPLNLPARSALRVYGARLLLFVEAFILLGVLLILVGWSSQALPVLIALIAAGQVAIIFALLRSSSNRKTTSRRLAPSAGFTFPSPVSSAGWEQLTIDEKAARLHSDIELLKAEVERLAEATDGGIGRP